MVFNMRYDVKDLKEGYAQNVLISKGLAVLATPAELAKQKAEISAKKNQQYALFGGLGLVLVFAGFMYNRFKITQKQKKSY
jgi:hypothetical protein